jgi:hypothetical protein
VDGEGHREATGESGHRPQALDHQLSAVASVPRCLAVPIESTGAGTVEEDYPKHHRAEAQVCLLAEEVVVLVLLLAHLGPYSTLDSLPYQYKRPRWSGTRLSRLDGCGTPR